VCVCECVLFSTAPLHQVAQVVGVEADEAGQALGGAGRREAAQVEYTVDGACVRGGGGGGFGGGLEVVV
jgi:hypothetical protein